MRALVKRLPLLLSLAIAVSVPIGAAAAAQQNASQVEIEVVPVREGVHMLTGAGGNMAVFLGEDGVLLVDAGYAELAERVTTAVQELCRRESANADLRYLINTHWHSDHTGANAYMAEAGATIVGHENVLRLLSADQVMAALGGRTVPAAPEAARPLISFNDRVNLRWNGDLIHVVHVPNAHTDGDAIVHFRDANVVHTGDIFFNGRYPYIDVDFGGHIGGMIAAVDEILAHTIEAALFIPGHGPLADRADLVSYRDMLSTVRDRIQEMIDHGRTRQEIIEAKPTADLDEVWSAPDWFLDPDVWVGLVYDGMMRAASGGGAVRR